MKCCLILHEYNVWLFSNGNHIIMHSNTCLPEYSVYISYHLNVLILLQSFVVEYIFARIHFHTDDVEDCSKWQLVIS